MLSKRDRRHWWNTTSGNPSPPITGAKLTSVANGFRHGLNFSGLETGTDVYDALVAIGNDSEFTPPGSRWSVVDDPTYNKVARLSFSSSSTNDFWMYLNTVAGAYLPNVRQRMIMRFNNYTSITELADLELIMFQIEGSDPWARIAVRFDGNSYMYLSAININGTAETTNNTDEATAMIAGGWREYILEINNNSTTEARFSIYANEAGTERIRTITSVREPYLDSVTPGFDSCGLLYAVINAPITIDFALLEVCDTYKDGSLIPIANMGS